MIQIKEPEILFILTLTIAILIMLVVFGREIINERFAPPGNNWNSGVTSQDVTLYFNKKGYQVRSVSPIPSTNKWIVCLNKKGEDEIITVHTKNNRIETITDIVI